jgi:hypothetical protein
MTDLPKDIERELAALADGSLDPSRRDAAVRRASASRELEQALAEQRQAVGLFAAVDVRAPASVHDRTEELLRAGRRGRERPSRSVGLAAATAALALGVAAIALSISGGDSAGLSVQQAAALTLRGATMRAPVESKAHRAQLTATVGGVWFPYWKERFGWRTSGARSDRVGGRVVTTVFYANAQGQRIGYAIASGRAPRAHGGTVTSRWGVQYRVLARDGATVVTWQRDGHLCVLGGRGVSAHTLLRLASWGSEKPRPA